MALTVLRDVDSDLVRVQQNVKKELDALELKVPGKKKPSTPVDADYAVKLVDTLVLALPATDINVTLPDVATCVGETFTVKNLSTAAVVYLRGQYVGGTFQEIDQAQKYAVPSQTAVSCYSDGKRWWIV